jgi:hypothetical protein
MELLEEQVVQVAEVMVEHLVTQALLEQLIQAVELAVELMFKMVLLAVQA